MTEPNQNTYDLGTVFITDKFPKQTLVSTIQKALEESGLNQNMAKEIAARGCFIRAKNNLKEEGIVLEVKRKDEQGRWLWQLSDRFVNENRLTLDFKASFWFDSITNEVGSTSEALKTEICDLVESYGKVYLANDLMRLVHKIFNGQSGLLALRAHGGVYFVPIQHGELLEKVMKFLSAIGCNDCVPIPVGQFGQGQLRDKAIQALVENTAMKLRDITDEIVRIEGEVDGKISKTKGRNRLGELYEQLERIKTFSASLRVGADELWKKASTDQIDLALLASNDVATIAAMAHAGGITGALGSILRAANPLPKAECLPLTNSGVEVIPVDLESKVIIEQFELAMPILTENELVAV